MVHEHEYEFGASKGFVGVEVVDENGVKLIQLAISGDDLDTLESAIRIARQYEEANSSDATT